MDFETSLDSNCNDPKYKSIDGLDRLTDFRNNNDLFFEVRVEFN